MVEVLLIELGNAVKLVFLQPLLYWALLLTLFTSYYRKKKEREDFGTSIFPIGSEWKHTWLFSLVGGIVISAICIGIGLSLTFTSLTIITLSTILLTLFVQLTALSPVYYVGLTVFALMGMKQFDVSLSYGPFAFHSDAFNETILLGLLSLLLIYEALLWLTVKKQHGFPRLQKGKRGKYIGRHVVKRLSILPIVIPIPNGIIEPIFPWWPLFPFGAEGYSLLLFPFLVGMQQSFQGMYGYRGASLIGKWLMLLAVASAGFAFGSYYFPLVGLIGTLVIVIARIFIQLMVRFIDLEKTARFTPHAEGLPILGVIPRSPAAKMGLEVGERIEKVNQVPVTSEQEFYDGIQQSRTFCKLEVRNLDGELRFVQGAMYQGDHHELGVVFVKSKPRFKLVHSEPTEVNMNI